MCRHTGIALMTLLAVAGCGGSETGVRIVVRLGPVAYDELRFGVTRDGETLVDPATKGRYAAPFPPGDQSVIVYLPDAVAGSAVRCQVAALRAGVVAANGSGDVVVERHQVKTVEIVMGAPGDPAPSVKANGDSCSVAAECVSGHCADGVCCESDCQTACRSCALPDTPGLCRPVLAGTPDPRGMCKDGGAATCQTNGLCGVAGECALYPAGTQCAAPECADMDRAIVPQRTCDGAGKCGEPPKKVKCSDDTRCVAGVCA